MQAVAALLLVANTIQVAAYSKRREVAVMKLVGASNWFIQAPFVLEAVVAGLVGSLLGLVALLAAKYLLFDGSAGRPLEGVALADQLERHLWLSSPLYGGRRWSDQRRPPGSPAT